MKLTAPPPPPPEPPEPGDPPGGEAPKGPDGVSPPSTTDAAAPPTADGAVPPPEPAPEPTPALAAKPATWPEWYAAADTALVALAVALTFLLASFAARNSDLWLHLAAGRMLTTGEYTLGSDPFSYTAADRAWVNHSWLFDLGAYLLYSGDGFALVIAKALAAAAAVALLAGIRRPGHALWPWAAVAVVAALAAAPRLTLHPQVGSLLFLSLTLFLVFRVPNPPGSWRLPIALGVTFWLWANTDAWFFLGPLVLVLLLVGELVWRKGLNAEGPPAPEDDTLGALPDVPTLARALGVGVVACMLTPHHVRVWQLPFELTESIGSLGDPRLNALLHSPLTGVYWNEATLGSNVNGLALLLLLAGGLYAVALTAVVGRLAGRPWDVEPLPLPHALLWCGFAALALKTMYAIPFLAAVSVPLLAGRLNALSARVALGPAADARTRMVLTLSALGRVASLLGIVALGVCAWPGWLHATGTNPMYSRRVTWEVAPDVALARAAGQFGEWRKTGRLGPDDRGFVASVDLANYVAWHAPGERVFANARYTHHAAEWPAFVKARQGLGVVRLNEAPDLKDAAAVFEAHKLTYAAVAAAAGDSPMTRVLAKEAMGRMWSIPDRWAAWYLDGRTAVSGWRADPAATPPTFDQLRVDPVALTFGPAAERLPPAPVTAAPPPRTWVDDFLRPVAPASPAADEAQAWLDYRDRVAGSRQALAFQVGALLLRAVPTTATPVVGANAFQLWSEGMARQGNSPYVRPADGSFVAIPILALKAARKAVAESPDHPDGYAALARALTEPELPVSESERGLGAVTAYRRALTRFPPPDAFTPGVYSSSPSQIAHELAGRYLSPMKNGSFRGIRVDLPGIREMAGEAIAVQGNQLFRVPLAAVPSLPPQVQVVDAPFHLPIDLAHDTLVLAKRYAERELGGGGEDESKERKEFRDQVFRGLKEQTDRVQAARQKATEVYRLAAERQPKVKDRFYAALRANLTGEAITMLKGLGEGELSREFGPDAPQALIQLVALELAVGWAEEAAGDSAVVREELDRAAGPSQAQAPPPIQAARGFLRVLDVQTALLVGDYETAGRELEATEGRGVGTGPPPSPEQVLVFTWPPTGALPTFGATVDLGLYFRSRVAQYQQARQAVLGQLDREATFFFRRGYLALLEGDVEGARVRFREASRPPQPAWDIPAVVLPAGPLYLRLIDQAARR